MRIAGFSSERDGERPPAAALNAALRLAAAIEAFRRVLPEHGLKLILPPPRPGMPAVPIALSAWRRGSVSVPLHRGRDAKEAMLLLLAAEAAREREAAMKLNCTRCRGLGWTISPDGARLMCPHPPTRPR